MRYQLGARTFMHRDFYLQGLLGARGEKNS